MFFNNKFNTFFGLNLTLVYTFPICMAWRFHFPIRNYDFKGPVLSALPLQSLNSHIVHVLPRQRRHSFQNKFYCPFDQFYLRQFKRIGTPSTPNIARINMANLVLLSDRSLCIILFSPLIRISAVAHRLECANDNRVFTGSNRTEVVWKLFFNFLYPT